MTSASPKPHLLAAGIALLVTAATVGTGLVYCRHLETEHVHAVASEFSETKLQGVALQRVAAQQPDLLLLYGSSELIQDSPSNANRFFSDYPTGFRVFPVGKEGMSSLATLEKIAALGENVRGKKIACSISPGFFFLENLDPSYYAGSFSELQAGELIFSSNLSRALRRDVARRMADYPETLDDNWILSTGVRALAGDGWVNRCIFAATLPLGRVQNAVLCAQDHFQTAFDILERNDAVSPQPSDRRPRGVNWDDLFRRTGQFVNAAHVQMKQRHVASRKLRKGSREKTFIATVSRAREWTDVELLLRVLKEMGANALMLTMPLEDVRLEALEVSPLARETLVPRLAKLARKYDVPILTFRERERGNSFLSDFSDHLSGEGWLYYNRALDDFFHGRLTSLF